VVEKARQHTLLGGKHRRELRQEFVLVGKEICLLSAQHEIQPLPQLQDREHLEKRRRTNEKELRDQRESRRSALTELGSDSTEEPTVRRGKFGGKHEGRNNPGGGMEGHPRGRKNIVKAVSPRSLEESSK